MENLQKFVVSLIYGSLTLLSFIVLINPINVNKKANVFFGMFLFFWSGYWLSNILAICQVPVDESFTITVNCLLIFTPVFLYFSSIFFINPNYKFRNTNLICLVIPIVYIVLLLKFRGDRGYHFVLLIDILHELLYITIIYFMVRHHQKRIETISSHTENINLQWFIKILFFSFVIIIITVGYEFYNAFFNKMNQHIVMDLLFLLMVYTTAYYALRQKEIYPVDEEQRKELLAVELDIEVQKEKKKLLSDVEVEEAKQKLTYLMESQKPYLDGELNLAELASLMNISAHQLSYLINKGFDENFFQFVNKYRVEHAKELLRNVKNNKFSLLGIAYESGFNSKTAFNTVFKKSTNLTPSEFQKTYSDL